MIGIALADQTPLAQLPKVDIDAVLAHTKLLASDAYEGRAPGTRGEEQTIASLVDQFKKIGLEPGNTDGTYIQKVPLVGITPDPNTALVFKKGGQEQRLKFKDDVVAWTKHVAETAGISGSDVVFVGYGVVAPEYKWDDYKGLDLKGKTLVMLVKDLRGQPLQLLRREWRVTTKPGKLYFTFFEESRAPFELPAMKNAVKRAYRLADGVAVETKSEGGKTSLNLQRPIWDPMATVVVVEIEGEKVER